MGTIGERIVALRKMLKLTQNDVATDIGIRQATVSRIEGDVMPPTDTSVKLICLKYRVSEEWLRTGEGEMFAPDPAERLISESEWKWINWFRALDDEGKQKELDRLSLLAGEELPLGIVKELSNLELSLVHMLAELPPDKRRRLLEYGKELVELSRLKRERGGE